MRVESTTLVVRPPANAAGIGVQYARILPLHGQPGVLLATYEENRVPDQLCGFWILRSADDGCTWEKIAHVREEVSGLSPIWNPTLFELPRACGDLPAGTILLLGTSIDEDNSIIQLYASRDGGYTWSWLSSVVQGGNYNHGNRVGHGVWEGFLILLDDNTLVCYYSDESQAEMYSQKIMYKTTRDGYHWSDPVTVIASSDPTHRPGMPVVTRLEDGSYFMVVEVVGLDGNPIHYKRSPDGLDWGDTTSLGTLLESVDGKTMGSAPFCGYSPVNHTLVVSASFMRTGESKTGSEYFISHDQGHTWHTTGHPLPHPANGYAYSNSFAFSEDGTKLYAVNNVPDANHPGKAEIRLAIVSTDAMSEEEIG